MMVAIFFFFSSRRRHTRSLCDWSSDVCSSDLMKMPPTGKLKDEEIADLGAWVKMGAVWPGASGAAATPPVRPASRELTAAEKSFWAFQPVKDPAVPSVKNQSWAQTPVDRFVLAKLEEKGLNPARP